jgi:hypothetical protein
MRGNSEIMFDDLDEDQIEAISALGVELAKHKWRPSKPYAEIFGNEKEDKNFVLGLRFIAENRDKIEKSVCRNGSVKSEIQAAGSTAAIVMDALQASFGVLIPVWSLSNVLCMLGLAKFCEKPPSSSTPLIGGPN